MWLLPAAFAGRNPRFFARSLAIAALFCCLASAVQDVDDASRHNLGIAKSLLGAQNPCGLLEREASAADPFNAAYVKVVSLVPQVGNLTSDSANVSLLYAWAAKCPPDARFSLAGNSNCPEGSLFLSQPKNLRFEGKLSYSYGKCAKEVRLDGRENPVRLELSEECAEGMDSLRIPLEVRLGGRVLADYSYSKSEYAYSCTRFEGGTGCGCEVISSRGTQTFSKEAFDWGAFEVESGKGAALFLNPPVQRRLYGNSTASVALLLRRMPSKISVDDGEGKALAEFSPYGFVISKGECGERRVEARYSPLASPGAKINTSAPLAPLQLASDSREYAPFSLLFPWREEPGKRELAIFAEGWFSTNEVFREEFFVRAPAVFAGGVKEEGGMGIREGSEREEPSAYPARENEGRPIGWSPLALALGLPVALALAFFVMRLDHRFS